jgi:hypothetical protein
MKKLFSFGSSPAKESNPARGNRLLTPEEKAAQEVQKQKLAEQQASAAARKKAQASAKEKAPRNRIVRPGEAAAVPAPRKSWFKRRKKTPKRTPQEKQERANRQSIAPVIRDILSGEFLTREGVTRHIPYLIFVSGLFIAYIAMGYQFERMEREKLRTKRQLEELSAEYKTLKATFETELQQSTVEQNIAELGLRQNVEPPFLLEYEIETP